MTIAEKSYKDLIAEREELERQITQARAQEVASAVAQIKAIMAEHSLRPSDVFPLGGAPKGRPSKPVEPKYRHPVTGETWAGRGLAPAWIANAENRDQYRIKPEVDPAANAVTADPVQNAQAQAAA
jgi:DNA-binding protein H-NS